MVDLESGHSDKSVDKLTVKGVSGHTSGHDGSQRTNKGHFKGQGVLYRDGEADEDRDKGQVIGHVR